MNLQLSDVEVRVPGRRDALFLVPSLRVPAGSSLLIHGPSGAGKTTLLHVLSGQFLPATGSLHLGETDLTALSASRRAAFRRRHIGIIFQRGNLIEHLTVRENIALGIPPGMPARLRTEQAIRRMDLAGMQHQRAGLLSPGEQQRVAVARIVAAEPDLILADEPTSSLDQANAETVMEALREASRGKTMVVVSHDPRILARFDAVENFAQWIPEKSVKVSA